MGKMSVLAVAAVITTAVLSTAPSSARELPVEKAKITVVDNGKDGATIIQGSDAAVTAALGAQPNAGYIYSCPVGNGSVWLDVWRSRGNAFGSTAWKFHQVLRSCYDGYNVTGYTSRYSYVSNIDSQHQYHGLVGDGLYYVNGLTQQVSFMQASFTNCIFQYGCISSSYPSITIQQWGYGGYWWTTKG